MDNQYLNQFSGISRLMGHNVFNKLRSAHVTIIGLGGVGTWSAEAIARSGVGEITLIDLDDICVTNTNRQLHALIDTVGKPKIEVLKDRLMKINPSLKVHCVLDFLTASTIEKILPKNSVVIDAIDSLGNKFVLATYCRQHEIPLIICGAAAGKQDPTQVRTGDLEKSVQDNLLKRLKKKLRNNADFPRTGPMGIYSVFSKERAMYPTPEGGLCFKQELADPSMAKMDCSEGMGSASLLTGTIGFAAAHLALKCIAQK